jgi:hypothetical protein
MPIFAPSKMRLFCFPSRPMTFCPIARCLFLLIGLITCFVPARSFAGDVTAVIKSPSLVYRLDAVTGAYKGSIQVNNATSVGCDGKTIAVLLKNGFVNRYSAESGAYQGSFQVGDNPESVQVSGGVIAVRTAKQLKRYKASNGSFLGSSQI